MKKIHILLLTILGAFALASCSDTEDPKIGNDYVAPVFDKIKVKELTVTKESNLAKVVEVWRWKAADYGVATQINYTLQADTLDGDFKSPAIIASVTTDTTSVTIGQLNKAALQFTDKAKPIKLKIRLSASISTMIEPIYSEIQTIVVTPYPSFPKNIYLTGDEFGNWEWAAKGTLEMIPVNGVEGAFWCINYFSAGKGFKLSPTKEWADAFGTLGQNDSGFTNDNLGNVILGSSGLYMVNVDLAGNKLIVEPVKLFGIGDCFGGWNIDKYPFTTDANGKTISIKTTGAGELRMYAVGSSPKILMDDWWKREFIILDGKINYRGNGGDQDRVSVAAGKTVTLDFRAGTGTIK